MNCSQKLNLAILFEASDILPQSAPGLGCGCLGVGFGRGPGCTARFGKTYFNY